MCRFGNSLLTLLFTGVTLVCATIQSTGARGKLICDGKPAGDIKLKLYDVRPRGSLDKKMAAGRSDDDGKFVIKGFVNGTEEINPKLNIYHDCDDGFKLCQRKFEIYIPDNYTTDSDNPRMLFDLGVIDLSEKWDNETRDCFH